MSIHDPLLRRLGYHFKTKGLLQTALTHRSAGPGHNERLEFLGDAVVCLVITDALYQQFPNATEGELTRLRATLVNRDTLGQLGRQFELGHYLQLGAGELKSGGSDRQSIISCAMEAIIGAIHQESGFEVARTTVLRWYEPILSSLPKAASLKDPKTRLQEWLQAKGLSLPVYTVLATEGDIHQQVFTVSCVVGKEEVKAEGSSRRRAEQAAAQKMLEKLSHD